MNLRHSLHRITRTALLATAFGLISTSHAMVARPTASTPIPVPAVGAAQATIGAGSQEIAPLLVAPTACTKSTCATRAIAPSVPLLVAPCHGSCMRSDPLASDSVPAARSNEKPLLVAPETS